MAQVYDAEVAQKLQPIVDFANDGVFPKMREGAQNTVDLAKEIGSASLERTANALVESSGSMSKLFDELFECIGKLQEYYKKLDAALG